MARAERSSLNDPWKAAAGVRDRVVAFGGRFTRGRYRSSSWEPGASPSRATLSNSGGSSGIPYSKVYRFAFARTVCAYEPISPTLRDHGCIRHRDTSAYVAAENEGGGILSSPVRYAMWRLPCSVTRHAGDLVEQDCARIPPRYNVARRQCLRSLIIWPRTMTACE